MSSDFEWNSSITPTAPNIQPRAVEPLGEAATSTQPYQFGESALEKEYQRRVKQGQDMMVVIADYHNDRGTGKTDITLQLADRCDRTEEGFVKEKASMQADDLIENYVEMPRGSSLVLDEAESVASKYEAGTAVNKAIRKVVSMGRVEEKYLFLNLPSTGELDRDLLKLAHVWILVDRKGRALVHILRNNPYRDQLLNPHNEDLLWDAIDTGTGLRNIYNRLTQQKRRQLRTKDKDSLVRESDVRKRITRAVKDAKREQRDEIICTLVNEVGYSPTDMEPAFDIKRARISQIASKARK